MKVPSEMILLLEGGEELRIKFTRIRYDAHYDKYKASFEISGVFMKADLIPSIRFEWKGKEKKTTKPSAIQLGIDTDIARGFFNKNPWEPNNLG